MMEILQILFFIIGGFIVACYTRWRTIREYSADLCKLRGECDARRAAENMWHDMAMSTHANNASLIALVELQNTHIAKLRHGNKDIPARNN